MLNRWARRYRLRPDLIQVPTGVRETFDSYLVCEFTTVKSGKPVTLPLLPFYLPDSGKFVVTSSILFSKKAENVKQNPKVSLLLSSAQEFPLCDHNIGWRRWISVQCVNRLQNNA